MSNLQSKAARPLRPVSTEPQESVSDKQNIQAAPVAQAVNVKGKRYVPFTGKESLPPYETKKGRVVLGEPRYALARGTGKRYKLLAYYRSPAGVERTLVRVLTNSGADKPLFDTLKKAGIPGAF